jgi:hypothetical protein
MNFLGVHVENLNIIINFVLGNELNKKLDRLRAHFGKN